MGIVTVCQEGCDATTIADGVALALDGDVVEVHEGLYAEALDIAGRRLTIEGRAGDAPVLMGASDRGRDALLIGAGSELTLRRLLISTTDVRPATVIGASLTLEDVYVTSTALWIDGGLIQVLDGALLAYDSRLDRGRAAHRGGLVHAVDSDVRLEYSRLEAGEAERGGCVFVRATAPGLASLEVEGARVERCAGLWGGAFGIEGPVDVRLAGAEVVDNEAEYGGAVYADGAAIEVSSGRYAGNVAALFGGAFDIQDGDIAFTLARVDGNVAGGEGGALTLGLGATASLFLSDFTANVASTGGAVAIGGGTSLDVVESTFAGNEGDLGGAIANWGTLTWMRGTACGNTASRGAAIDHAGDALTVHNVGFSDNVAEAGGAVAVLYPNAVDVAFSAFLGNEARDGAAVSTACGRVTGNLFVGNTGAAAVTRGVDCEDPVDNVFWDNPDGDLLGGLGANTAGDPLLFDNNVPCGIGPPSWAGASVDAGPADVLDHDGSRSDAGLFGGPDAYPHAWEDGDGDGTVDFRDCGDADRGAHVDEVWYDGTDQDCDHRSDHDQDLDGHDREASGGDDCDDTDATLHPSAADVPWDAIDQDCDGADANDLDGDGYLWPHDCDDTDATVNPGTVEDDLRVDEDCDGYRDRVGAVRPRGCASSPSGSWATALIAGLLARRRWYHRRTEGAPA